MDFKPDDKRALVTTQPFSNPLIKPDDLLSITINTVDPNITKLLNNPNAVAQTSDAQVSLNQQTIPGYIVDKDGDIVLPFAGKMKVSGLTTNQARDTITTAMAEYVKEPIVSVKFGNFRVSLIGEVNRPATYIIPTERVSILNALATAGDLTIYGIRTDITIIRDTGNNQKLMIHLNIQDKNIMSSPYFYLQPNDIVYVKPNRAKAALTDAAQTRLISLGASIASVLFVIFNRIKF